MKYCSHCGRELLDEAVICPGCGCACNGNGGVPSNTDKWNGLAIAGFIVSFFSAVVGLILSVIGYRQCKNTGEKGKSLALAGTIIGIVRLVLEFFVFVFYYIIFLNSIGAY